MPNPLVLFGSAVVSQVPAIPGVVADDGWRWALQTGGFGALFAVLAYVSLRWLAGQLARARDAEDRARDAEVENLKGVLGENNKILARLLPVLERIETKLNR